MQEGFQFTQYCGHGIRIHFMLGGTPHDEELL